MTPDVSHAAKLATSLALRTIAFDRIEGRALLPATPTGTVQWALDPPTVSWQQVERELTVTLPFEIAVTGGGARCYDMRVTLRAVYDVVAELPVLAARDVDHYAGISSVLHAWPYLRAEVQALSTKLGMGAPVVLPNITAGQLPETVEVKRGKAASPKVKARRSKA